MRAVILALFVLLVAVPSFAHPDLARHGYGNCTACHVSPNGGGILNAYGRSLSAALLSTWGTEEEGAPFYGIAKLPETLEMQAFIKGVQYVRDNARVLEGDFIVMQRDLEAAGTFGKVTGVVAAGVEPGVLEFSSRRHYLLVQATETTSIRAGKFLADYGINVASHGASTRDGIGFGEGSETYNLEVGYQGDFLSGALTGVFGELDQQEQSEKGFAVNASAFLSEKFKIGGSYFYGNRSGNSRSLLGSYAILGFAHNFYYLAELDLTLEDGTGYVSYHRIGYDVIQGVQPYLLADLKVPDLSQDAGRRSSWGGGVMWNPRPHFEVQLEGQRRSYSGSWGNETLGFLVFGIYL